MSMSSGRLTEILAFVRVAEGGSMTAAAVALGLSPSAVSRQIARLEERLGAQLLARTTRRVAPTEIGRAFLDRCRRILADLDEAEAAVGQAQLRPRGLLRLDLPVAFGERIVAPLLPQFLARYPEVELTVSYNDRTLDLLAEGLDLTVRITAGMPDSSLVTRRLARNRRVLCAAPSYLAAHGRPESPADLARHACVVQLLGNLQPRDELRFEGPDGPFWVKINGRLRSSSVQAVLSAVLAGEGLALLPTYYIGDDIAAGRLEPVLTQHLAYDVDIAAVWLPTRHLSPKVRCMVDFLADAIGHPDAPVWDRRGALA